MIGTTKNTFPFEETLKQVCSLLIFQLAGQAFALNIDSISQIIPMLKLTPLPQSGDMLEGVFNLHGRIIPVINFRRLLGLPDIEADLNTPIILTTLGDQQVGWIVDEVLDVVNLPTESITPPGEILPEGMPYAQIMTGLFFQQEHPVIILDPGCIQRSAQFRTISRLLDENRMAEEIVPETINAVGEPGRFETASCYPPEDASEMPPAAVKAALSAREVPLVASPDSTYQVETAARMRKSPKRGKRSGA